MRFAAIFCWSFFVDCRSCAGSNVYGRSAISQRSKTLFDRPALLGTGTNSLVNQIAMDLIKKGQKDGGDHVLLHGRNDRRRSGWTATYRGTPGSKLPRAGGPETPGQREIYPAIHDHQPVSRVVLRHGLFCGGQGKAAAAHFCQSGNRGTEKGKRFHQSATLYMAATRGSPDCITPKPDLGRW